MKKKLVTAVPCRYQSINFKLNSIINYNVQVIAIINAIFFAIFMKFATWSLHCHGFETQVCYLRFKP